MMRLAMVAAISVLLIMAVAIVLLAGCGGGSVNTDSGSRHGLEYPPAPPSEL